MCGINGFVDRLSQNDISSIQTSNKILSHRGPDDAGEFYVELDGLRLGLGHVRLSILDLSENGSQPMSYQNLVLVYNGEIYNYEELRDELINLGYSFVSDSDTEVALKALHFWGVESAVNRFNGMFAIALLDKDESKLYLIRDRAGVKPLFYELSEEGLFFSSEINVNGFREGKLYTLDKKALFNFLRFGYVPQPYSIFEEIRKLEAGHYLTYDITSGDCTKIQYWDISDSYRKSKHNLSETSIIQSLHDKLVHAVKYRLKSDVPVGVFLSGGLDSSTTAAICQSITEEPIKTFTVSFVDENFNEGGDAQRIANYIGSQHYDITCHPSDADEMIRRIGKVWGEPFGDSSAIPTMLVSKLASEHVKVVLSADGGDEIFGGYTKYQSILKKARILTLIPRVAKKPIFALLTKDLTHKILSKLGFASARERCLRYSRMLDNNSSLLLKEESSVFSERELSELMIDELKPEECKTFFDRFVSGNNLDNIMAIDYSTYQVDDILVKVDRATMAFSIEGREPLLDFELAEFSARLKTKHKIRGNKLKIALRAINEKYFPANFIGRKKKGFSVPIENWLRNELRYLVEEFMSDTKIRNQCLLNADIVLQIRDNFLNDVGQRFEKFWFLFTFFVWLDERE